MEKEQEENILSRKLREHLDRIDRVSAGTVKIARSYYETNRKINIVIIAVGISLLANAVGYAWYTSYSGGVATAGAGANLWSIFSGGLGMTAFATLFFLKPQGNITKALGNLTQIQMICKSYCLQFDTILEYHVKNDLKNIHELNDMIITLQNNTSAAVKLIQSEIESDIESKLREEDEEEKGIFAKPIVP
ncbi:MAG: hypothetical protein WAM26_14700 [Nitrososphaeraceae archaeon]